jgi:RHS repeat-associated protein
MTFTLALAPAITAARYSYAGHTDNPQHILDSTGAVVEGILGLPGNTTFTSRLSEVTYSHANVHGDTITITDSTGQRLWTGYNGPYGETPVSSAPPNTNVANTSWGWHGQQQRLTDGPIIHMGARPYSPGLGRFLAVDPIEGGCANDYTYVRGDPLNSSDVTGTGIRDWLTERWDDAKCWYNNNKAAAGVILAIGAVASPWLGVTLILTGGSLFVTGDQILDAWASKSMSGGASGSTSAMMGIAGLASKEAGQGLIIPGVILAIWDSTQNPSRNDCY